ncbi:MAG: anhydro-N-acetylmuramic acid kinase [Alphaproteobacteria bacterium]|nr:anhydro-N-acetylmuramic acid kinase [Alphaproteobacteria bacterium]
MKTYRIIGNMTGNSMDAIDLVLTEFHGGIMKDICSYSAPYSREMQAHMETLRQAVFDKSPTEILSLPKFKQIHDSYVHQIADCINKMCQKYQLDKKTIDAIGFHGKTLDHNPPSQAKINGRSAYTLQIGSGQMLANLTNIPVVYDFRSDFIMNGFEGAPLIPPHNAHISATEGDGCYYNGGNTSNFAWVISGKAVIGADAGPFNEYIDAYIRQNTSNCYDKDGQYGKVGTLDKALLQKLYDIGSDYYEQKLPKSGDPQYYHRDIVFKTIQEAGISFNNAVHTLEYFAAYIAVQALTLTEKKIPIIPNFILFGGGWKNPVVRGCFEQLITGQAYILPQHRKSFNSFYRRFIQKPTIRYSHFGEMMEARLFADLARYKLENKAWEIPETILANHPVICGVIAYPGKNQVSDYINRAAKGWQRE